MQKRKALSAPGSLKAVCCLPLDREALVLSARARTGPSFSPHTKARIPPDIPDRVDGIGLFFGLSFDIAHPG
jgi:hypothetical protein